MRLACACAALLLVLPGCTNSPSSPASVSAARQVVVLGDSITYDGHWVEDVEGVLRLTGQAPSRPFLNLALPSETVSGLSEEGHAGGRFPRPDLHERLDRVLAKTHPDLVIACYGENDGLYEPFSPDRFRAFQNGIAWLRMKVAQAGARLILLTPPGFDPVPISEKVAQAGQENATHPFEGYDEVLARYSEWLMSLRAQGVTVIDVHSVMGLALAGYRDTNLSFAWTKDGVHPNPTGQLVFAKAVLNGLGFSEAQLALANGWDVHPPPMLKLIRDQDSILKDAWLTETGHTRPGMKKGLPLPEAQAQADALQRQIEDAKS